MRARALFNVHLHLVWFINGGSWENSKIYFVIIAFPLRLSVTSGKNVDHCVSIDLRPSLRAARRDIIAHLFQLEYVSQMHTCTRAIIIRSTDG